MLHMSNVLQFYIVSVLITHHYTSPFTHFFLFPNHRRRIYSEEKEMVVAAAWGTELLQFLAALDNLHQDDWKNTAG